MAVTRNKLRICIFAKAMTAHRDGKFLWPFTLISRELFNLGHDVVVITTAHPDGKTTLVKEDGVEIHYLKKTKSEKSNKAFWEHSASLFDDLHMKDPFSIVMGRGSSSAGFLDKSRFAGTIPLISHEGTYPSWLHAYKTTPSPVSDIFKWTHAYADATAKHRQAKCLTKSDLVIGNSKAITEGIGEAFWWNPPPTRFIPYSFSPRQFLDNCQQELLPDDLIDWCSNSKKYLVYVGRVTRKKGAADMLHVLKASADKNLHLLICGAINSPNQKRIEQLAKKLGLTNRIKIAGPVPHKTLPFVLSKAKAFLFPSVHPESLPKSVMEAMAAGLPILGYAIPALKELVKHGEGGFLAKPGDTKGLAMSLITLLTDKPLRKQMGKSAYERISRDFKPETVGQLWEETLQSCIVVRKKSDPVKANSQVIEPA